MPSSIIESIQNVQSNDESVTEFAFTQIRAKVKSALKNAQMKSSTDKMDDKLGTSTKSEHIDSRNKV